MFLKLISIYHTVILKTALLMKPNLKCFSYLFGFPGGFDDGNLFKSFTSKIWACHYEVQLYVVFIICKIFVLNILELTLEIIHFS